MSANIVKYGLKNVYYAKGTVAQNGSITYDTPKPILGAVSLTGSAVGDSNDFFADNKLYYSESANQGYEGDLECAMLPDDFYKDIFGYTTDDNGALVENANAKPSPFALGFQVDGDKKDRKTWYYNCSASRPNNDANTTEASKTPNTQSMSIKMMPRKSDSLVKITMEESADNTAAYNSFFASVYEPVVTTSSTTPTGV